MENDEADEDANLNEWNCRVKRGEDRRKDERRVRKWLGDGSARMSMSLKEWCKKIRHSKNKHHEYE
jgi:hypothetical protein